MIFMIIWLSGSCDAGGGYGFYDHSFIGCIIRSRY